MTPKSSKSGNTCMTSCTTLRWRCRGSAWISGWNGSYTGDPIPLKEMVEWRSATVDRIMALQPRRVLEIGAGSGLVLSQIAPCCEHYVGTDISAVAIDTLARSLEQLRIGWRDRVSC